MKPHTQILNGYAADVCERISKILKVEDAKLVATVYEIAEHHAYDVVCFERVSLNDKRKSITNKWVRDISVICGRSCGRVREAVSAAPDGSFHRIYDGKMLYIMKPPRDRFWSLREAEKDTSMIIDDHMRNACGGKNKHISVNPKHTIVADKKQKRATTKRPPKPKHQIETSKHATKRKPSKRTRNTQITAHPFIYSDKTHIRIDGFVNVMSSCDLPGEYLRGTPSYYLTDADSIVALSGKRITTVRVGSTYPVAKFDEIMDTMKAAGARFGKMQADAAFVVEI